MKFHYEIFRNLFIPFIHRCVKSEMRRTGQTSSEVSVFKFKSEGTHPRYAAPSAPLNAEERQGCVLHSTRRIENT